MSNSNQEAQEMIHVEMDKDEWYPVYEPVRKAKPSEYTITVPLSVVERWERVQAEFEECQDEMSKWERNNSNGR